MNASLMSLGLRWCASTNNPSTHARSALLGKLVARGLFLDAYWGYMAGATVQYETGGGGRYQGPKRRSQTRTPALPSSREQNRAAKRW